MGVTVEQFLRQNPKAILDLMTPQGLIRLAPGQAQWLLTPEGSYTKLMVARTRDVVMAPDLLSQIIFKIVPYRGRRNHYFLLTNTPAEAAKRRYHPRIEYEQMTFDLSHRR